MKYYVGFKDNFGSEEKARNRNHFGASKTVGHKGQEGSNPNFPDNADHVGTCVKIENETVYMKCTCGLEWHFPEAMLESIEDVPTNYGLLGIENVPKKIINKNQLKFYNFEISEITKKKEF